MIATTRTGSGRYGVSVGVRLPGKSVRANYSALCYGVDENTDALKPIPHLAKRKSLLEPDTAKRVLSECREALSFRSQRIRVHIAARDPSGEA